MMSETLEERIERCRKQSMRDHPFIGEGVYCEGLVGPSVSGSPDTGVLTMRIGCGWPRDMHPKDVSKA